jgi:hypothetical protein
MRKLTLVVVAVMLRLCSPGQAEVYTDATSFQNAIGGASLTSSPLYSSTYGDAYGNFSPPAQRAGTNFTAPVEGSISGQFGCFGNKNPCNGAYRETITFPIAVTAIEGQLSLFDETLAFSTSESLLGLSKSLLVSQYLSPNLLGSPNQYEGFYAETFAPTRTLTFNWIPGLYSADARAEFTLSSALVLVDTPEPATWAILLMPMLGIVISRGEPKALRALILSTDMNEDTVDFG